MDRPSGKLPWASVVVIPLVLFAEQIALGADSAFLAAGAALAEMLAVLVIFLLSPPNRQFWSHLWPMLLLGAALLVWMAQPLLAPGLLPSRTAAVVVPDLQEAGLVRLIAGLALLVGAAALGYRRGAARHVVDILLLSGIVAVGVAMIFRQMDPERVWGFDKGILTMRFTGTLLNANASACISTVLALLGLGRLMSAIRDGILIRPTRSEIVAPYLSSLAIIAGVGACAISGSRTALVTLLVLGVALVATDRSVRSRVGTRGGRIALGIAVAVTLFLLSLLARMTVERFGAMDENVVSRVDIWENYWRIATAAPWTGYGLLSFDQINEISMRTPLQAYTLWYIHSAHNWVLSLLLSGGIPYLVLASGMGAVVLVEVVRSRRRKRIDQISRALLASLLAIVICASVDIALDVPVISATMMVLGGLLYGKALRAR